MIAWGAFAEYFIEAGEKAKIGVGVIFLLALLLRGRNMVRRLYEGLSRIPTKTFLSMILSTAFLLRLGWVIWSPHVAPSAATEDMIMLRLARDLAAGQGYRNPSGDYTAERPIGYPVLLSLLFRLLGERIWLIEMLQVTAGVLGIFLVYLLGRQIFHRGVGLIAASLLAVYPTSIFASKIVLEEHVFIVLWLAGIGFLISDFLNPRWLKVIAMGMIFGIAAHFRTYAFAMGSVVLFSWILWRRKFWEGLVRAAVVQILILFWAAPWAVRNYYRLGEPILYTSTIGVAFYYAHNPTSGLRYPVNPTLEQGGDPAFLGSPTELQRNRAGKRAAWKWIRENPRLFFEKALGRAFYHLGLNREGWTVKDNFHTIQEGRTRPSEKLIRRLEKLDSDYYGYIFLLALIGLILFLFHQPQLTREKSLWCILLTLMYYLSIVALTLNHRKYRFVIEPLFCVLAAYGLFDLWFGKVRRERARSGK